MRYPEPCVGSAEHLALRAVNDQLAPRDLDLVSIPLSRRSNPQHAAPRPLALKVKGEILACLWPLVHGFASSGLFDWPLSFAFTRLINS
jgi:hypothetical protein